MFKYTAMSNIPLPARSLGIACLPYTASNSFRYSNSQTNSTANNEKYDQHLNDNLGTLVEILHWVASLSRSHILLMSLHQCSSSRPHLSVTAGLDDLDIILVEAGFDIGFVNNWVLGFTGS